MNPVKQGGKWGMTYPYTLSFRNDVSVHRKGGDIILTNGRISALRLKEPSPGLSAIVDSLSDKGGTEDALCNILINEDGASNLGKFYYHLSKLMEKDFLCRTVKHEGQCISTLEPISKYFQFKEQHIDSNVKYRISRFAYCHDENGRMVLESPLGHCRLVLHDWRGAAYINMLSQPCTVRDINIAFPDVNKEVVRQVFVFLFNTHAICEVDEDGNVAEEHNNALLQWEFHDLLLHARSRAGRHSNPVGGTYRFMKKIDPLPAVKTKMNGETVELYKPDIEKLKKDDVPFTFVVEKRCSVRENGEDPLTAEQIGEFLYRSARIRKIMDAVPEKGLYSQVSNRPYAGGGAIYELELYLTINRCKGLEKGMYHYDPKEHTLTRISDYNDKLEKLLKDASRASARDYLPDTLITYTARFQRFMWKYQSMAYAVILKDAGLLMQNMYLVATAMNLAPCAIGNGDSDLFAEASGLDYYVEGSVGEFTLESKKK
ncbi:MAG: dehydrogenase [Parcubacteria group bacterium]|jgi:SagB-type dehydrogenase family enzyme|nr:dehydrogenase [Parcubacteria group bacterium]|tara:strand:+ start:88 stop:1548 length:1461 start_codon:yes stop_codon:yes gene_type:complete